MPPTDDVEAAILKVADTIGGLMEAWGFKRNMGRVWAMLYLEHGADPNFRVHCL